MIVDPVAFRQPARVSQGGCYCQAPRLEPRRPILQRHAQNVRHPVQRIDAFLDDHPAGQMRRELELSVHPRQREHTTDIVLAGFRGAVLRADVLALAREKTRLVRVVILERPHVEDVIVPPAGAFFRGQIAGLPILIQDMPLAGSEKQRERGTGD